MSTDVKESDEAYEMEMDLPGFKKEDVNVSLNNGYLTVNAVKNYEKNDEDEKDCKYIRKERCSGTCSRSFYVGEHLTEEDIKAKFENGILKLNIPKIDPKSRVEEKKCIPIEG